MSRTPTPWYWKQRRVWCAYINGKKIILAHARTEAHCKFHELIAAEPEHAASDSVAAIIDTFLGHIKEGGAASAGSARVIRTPPAVVLGVPEGERAPLADRGSVQAPPCPKRARLALDVVRTALQSAQYVVPAGAVRRVRRMLIERNEKGKHHAGARDEPDGKRAPTGAVAAQRPSSNAVRHSASGSGTFGYD